MSDGLNSPQVMGGQKLPGRPLNRALQEWRVLSLARQRSGDWTGPVAKFLHARLYKVANVAGGGRAALSSLLPPLLLVAEEVEDVFACVDHRAQASTRRLGLGWACRGLNC